VNRLLFSVAACGVLLAATLADAQQPGQGRGRGGPGFGGGFGPQGKLQLVNNDAVQKDLALKEDQVGKVKELGDQVREEMRAGGSGAGSFADFQNLSQEERDKRIAEAQTRREESAKKINDKFLPLLSEILTEEQETRLQQIVWQANGVEALVDKELAAKLKLSNEQQDKLASLSKEYSDKRAEMFRGFRPGQGGQDAFAKMGELRETRDKNMNDVLTAEQKAELTKLKGKEFDVAQLRGRGFGGPGGGQGGAGQGRPGGGEGRPGGRPDGQGRPGQGRPQPNPQ
jgi:Spy/CpxP family protein refolding chaperone